MNDPTASSGPKKGAMRLLIESPYLFGLCAVSSTSNGRKLPMPDLAMQFASLGGFLFGYDQGVVSGVLTMQSFGAQFPKIYLDSGFKGWFVSSLLLLAWFGSLVNGLVADRFGRKGSMLMAVVVFVVGSAIQAGAVSVGMLFAGKACLHICNAQRS